ncbi:hypothetical protein JCM30760_25730 [Thiomicrorhabdus hydrogeniphila]
MLTSNNLITYYYKKSRNMDYFLAKNQFYKIILGVFLSVVFGAQAFFNTALASEVISQSTWQKVAQQLPEPIGVFNKNLRVAVQKELVLPQLDVLAEPSKLITRLQTLDKGIFKYVRVSESSTRFVQLQHLMPALVNIEERKFIEQYLKNHNMKVPRLRGSRLSVLLDKRIARLANGLIFNMKPLVRQRREFEQDLMKAMANNGIEFSARPPDFILDYDLKLAGQESENQWKFFGELSLLNTFEMPIIEVKNEILEQGSTQEIAQAKGMQQLANMATKQLKEFLINTIKH